MAYTRIHAIKATVQKALKYICNPEKTDGQILIDSFSCGVETAHYDFMDALSKSSGVGYTKEAIRDRIEKRVKAQEKFPVKKKIPFPKRSDAKRILIDTDKEKFQANGALKHWADIQNLKIAAASYAEGGSVEELERKITKKMPQQKRREVKS